MQLGAQPYRASEYRIFPIRYFVTSDRNALMRGLKWGGGEKNKNHRHKKRVIFLLLLCFVGTTVENSQQSDE